MTTFPYKDGRWSAARPIILCIFLTCIALCINAQEAAPPAETPDKNLPHNPPITLIPRSHEEREMRYRSLHRVILNVEVTDANGKPVKGLKEEDFTLLDNRQTQTLASFREVAGSAGFAPARVVLLIDALNESPRSLKNDRGEINHFLEQGPSHLPYPTSIAVLSDSGVLVGKPFRDRDDVLREVNEFADNLHSFECVADSNLKTTTAANVMPGVSAVTASTHALDCLNQRFQRSVSALNKLARREIDAPGRVILIWIGPGWPLLTGKEFLPDTAALRDNFFSNLVDLSTAIREAQVTLDSVAVPDLFHTVELRNNHEDAFLDGVPTSADASAGSLALELLAHQSGGQIVNDSKDIVSGIAKCLTDAESFYVLSFDSPAATVPGEFHSVQIRVDIPGVRVRSNTMYYGQP